MRIRNKSRNHFCGTHKGALIEIEREPDGRFYIFVTHADGGRLYDGWAPESVRRMKDAKREACYGACLDQRQPSNTSTKTATTTNPPPPHGPNP